MNNNSISLAATPKIKANRLTNAKTLRIARRWEQCSSLMEQANGTKNTQRERKKNCRASKGDKCIAFYNEDKKYDTKIHGCCSYLLN